MKFIVGNIFESNTEALVNTVNTVGVMGKGIALQFKKRFPENFQEYLKACKNGEVKIGKMFITATNSIMNPKWIINFPTKKHWIQNSKYEFIEEGLKDLIIQIEKYDIKSLAIPPLGAGQGGLDWNKVKKLIIDNLRGINIEISVFEPSSTNVANNDFPSVHLTKPRAMILNLIDEYRKLGYEISFLEIQKIAYFLQRMGQIDLRLNFKKYLYGPYAHNLQHLLHELEKGYIISDKSVFDSKPLDLIQLNSGKIKEVKEFLELNCNDEEKDRLNNIKNLMDGFESPFGLELLASVDWIINNNDLTLSSEDIKVKIDEWSKRKGENFKIEHIRVALIRLSEYKNELNYKLF